ncbi:hypothetical protein HDU82_008903 [Entophlyctis luteolus]|nr:hypothetical protein HDU82_008903 [Entophlyctis luteolus]
MTLFGDAPVSTLRPSHLKLFRNTRPAAPTRMDARDTPASAPATPAAPVRRQSGFYVIDALDLKHPARKPFHVAARIKQKAHSHPSDITIPPLVEERRSRLARRHSYVRNVMIKHRKANVDAAKDADAQQRRISDSIDKAGRNRARLIDSHVKTNASRVAHAKEVAAEQKVKSVEKKDALRRDLEERFVPLHFYHYKTNMYVITAFERLKLEGVRDKQFPGQDFYIPLTSSRCTKISVKRRLNTFAKRQQSPYRTGGVTTSSITFEKLVRLVQSKQVIKGATVLISYLKSFASKIRMSEGVVFKNPARVFLSAYIIVAHTNEIMPSFGAKEEAVKKAASDLLTNLESWLSNVTGFQKSFSVSVLKNLIAGWIAYYEQFESWKEQDTMKIVDGLIAHYLELENLWLTVKDQMVADAEWKPRIEDQQRLIISRLQKFGDRAMEKFIRARHDLHVQFGLSVSDADLENELSHMSVDGILSSNGEEQSPARESIRIVRKGKGPATQEMSPPSQSASLLATSPQRFPGRFMASRPTSSDSVSRPNSVSPHPKSRVNSPVVEQNDAEKPRTPLISAPSSEKLESLSATPEFGDLLSNQKLAHELTLDPEFNLKKPQLNEIEQKVRHAARKAFFDQVKQTFKDGQFDVHVPEFLVDIKQQILSMVSAKGKFAVEIEEALDLEFIKQQIKNKSLNLVGLLQFILSKMALLCAPQRDNSIKAIVSELAAVTGPEGLASVFDGILTVLDDMKLDLANYKLQSLRPHLKTQAVEYEKAKFKEYFESAKVLGPSTAAAVLPRTKAWLEQTVNLKAQTARDRNPENVDLPENKIRYADILHDALLNLVFSPIAVSPEAIAETLIMDCERVFKFQNEGQLIVIVASLLMLVQNIVVESRGNKAFLGALKDRLLALLKAPEGLTVESLGLEIISKCDELVLEKRRSQMNLAGKSSDFIEGLDDAKKDMVRNMVDKTLSTKDPVFGLLKRRVQASIKSHVLSGLFKREGLEKAGLNVVSTELEGFSTRVAIWVRFNMEVYAEWYDEILHELC